MKKKLLIIGALMMLATYGFSQFELKTDPIGILFGSVPVSAECLVKNNIGIEFTYSYLYLIDKEGTKGFNGVFFYKYYFNPDLGGDKLYIAPYISYSGLSGESTIQVPISQEEITTAYKSRDIGVGFAVGYKWVFPKGILIDIAGGIGGNFSIATIYENPNYPFLSESKWTVGYLGRISVGYRFRI